MTTPFIFKAAARRDFHDAFDWYEQQESGRGDMFAAAVEQAIGLLARHPGLHPTIHRDIRAQPVRGYPYRIFYRLRAAKIIVIALHHDRRNPESWQRRT